jgi:hypothetical protein
MAGNERKEREQEEEEATEMKKCDACGATEADGATFYLDGKVEDGDKELPLCDFCETAFKKSLSKPPPPPGTSRRALTDEEIAEVAEEVKEMKENLGV